MLHCNMLVQGIRGRATEWPTRPNPFPPPTPRQSPPIRMGTRAMVDRAAADALICEADISRPTDAPATACPTAVAPSVDREFLARLYSASQVWRDVARNRSPGEVYRAKFLPKQVHSMLLRMICHHDIRGSADTHVTLRFGV
jgi:hypothetical protein